MSVRHQRRNDEDTEWRKSRRRRSRSSDEREKRSTSRNKDEMRGKVFPVYVGNIPIEAEVASLRDIFGRVGKVLEVTIIADYGFVNYRDHLDAIKAIRLFNGYKMFGRSLHVDLSQELEGFLLERGEKVENTRNPEENKETRSRSPPKRRRTVPSPPRRTSSPRRPSRSPEKKRRQTRSRSPRSPRREKERRSSGSSTLGRKANKIKINLLSNQDNDVKEQKPDLREMLKKRHKNSGPVSSVSSSSEVPACTQHLMASKGRKGFKIQINSDLNDEGRKVMLANNSASASTVPDPSMLQELYVGNLFNEVEKDDLARLFEPHGKVLQVSKFSTHAIVSIECTREEAESIIQALDKSLWMDNNIRVQFNLANPRFRPATKNNCDKGDREEEPREPRPRQRVNPEQIDSFLKQHRMGEEPKKLEDSKFVQRHFVVYSQATPKSFLSDMAEVFSRFGTVNSCKHNVDGLTISIALTSSERRALKCIDEANSINYKGSRLRVRFEEGSLEDKVEFRRKHLFEFRHYPDPLVPFDAQPAAKQEPLLQTAVSQEGKVPIGVLPPSSSLGAFAVAAPTAITSFIRNYRQPPDQRQMAPAASQNFGPSLKPLTEDPMMISSVEGEIHSVHNKIVLIQFFTGFSFQLAKLTPGQMYVNGKKSLGYIIKNNTFHTWPLNIRNFLHQGARVLMDVRKMNDREMAEAKDVSSENVMYFTPLVWRSRKPQESDITVSLTNERMLLLKGTVSKLMAKWGVLSHDKGNAFFPVDTLFVKSANLTREDSLLDHLSLGDTLGVQCYPIDYLEMAEFARNFPGFRGTTDNLNFRAKLVWHIVAEVDPFAHKISAANTENLDEMECDFLTSSSTLNRQLPFEKDATHSGWPGIIEEIHLPAGGIVLLNESLGLDMARRRVYFHRSRIYVNGAKIPSNTSIDDEIIPGDPVTVDVVLNRNPDEEQDGPSLRPLVFSDAFWVALAVQANTRDRGAQIAQKLRLEVFPWLLASYEGLWKHLFQRINLQISQYLCGGMECDFVTHSFSTFLKLKKLFFQGSERSPEHDVYLGRIIFFNRPTSSMDPVESGIAVIDTGPYTGQRVEFDRRQCSAFGASLAKADLSLIFTFGKCAVASFNNKKSKLPIFRCPSVHYTETLQFILRRQSVFGV